METLDSIKSEISQLIDQGIKPEILPKIRELEGKKKELEKVQLLNSVNSKYKALRELGKLVYETEKPLIDITCNDGTFHKTKVKNYPNINKLSIMYGRATKTKGNLILEMSVGRDKFDLYKTTYEYQKENVYTPFETFEDFLSHNSIPLKEITIDEYNDFSTKLKEANEELQKAIKVYEEKRKELNVSSFQYYGLATQSNIHQYTYSAKI